MKQLEVTIENNLNFDIQINDLWKVGSAELKGIVKI